MLHLYKNNNQTHSVLTMIFVISSWIFICGCSQQGELGHSSLGDKGYLASTLLWQQTDISVCWENYDEISPSDRGLVYEAVENSWASVVPFNFFGWEQCKPDSRGIRILGEDSQARAYMGTSIDGVKNGMILNFEFMNFSRLCRRSEIQRQACISTIAVHEFGHALGLDHEQERGDTPAWCREEYRANGYGGDLMVGEWDLDSVMNYCNPEWAGNGQLSDGDIETIRFAYQHLFQDRPASEKYQCDDLPPWEECNIPTEQYQSHQQAEENSEYNAGSEWSY